MSDPRYDSTGTPETRVIEECSELIQALCKAERFGWFESHPDRQSTTNIDDVFAEMDDLLNAMNKLDAHLRELRFEQFKEINSRHHKNIEQTSC